VWEDHKFLCKIYGLGVFHSSAGENDQIIFTSFFEVSDNKLIQENVFPQKYNQTIN